jgi:hypothetical protein
MADQILGRGYVPGLGAGFVEDPGRPGSDFLRIRLDKSPSGTHYVERKRIQWRKSAA